jgi:hypothetical protein
MALLFNTLIKKSKFGSHRTSSDRRQTDRSTMDHTTSAMLHEKPPAYAAAPPPVANLPPQDDPYAFLSTFDTIFVIDDSYSMGTPIHDPNSRTRRTYWDEARSAVEAITPICTDYDSNGIDMYFLNGARSPFHHNITSVATVREIFSSTSPMGCTPTGQCLNSILTPYLQAYSRDKENTKPINIIVITDGVPTDDDAAPLISAARKLDALEAPLWQVGVQFFQVGNDPGAGEHLRQLDDDLRAISGDAKLRDLVDTVNFEDFSKIPGGLSGQAILKVVLGAVNRRLDRKAIGKEGR